MMMRTPNLVKATGEACTMLMTGFQGMMDDLRQFNLHQAVEYAQAVAELLQDAGLSVVRGLRMLQARGLNGQAVDEVMELFIDDLRHATWTFVGKTKPAKANTEHAGMELVAA